jgi:hypothetical protein
MLVAAAPAVRTRPTRVREIMYAYVSYTTRRAGTTRGRVPHGEKEAATVEPIRLTQLSSKAG